MPAKRAANAPMTAAKRAKIAMNEKIELVVDETLLGECGRATEYSKEAMAMLAAGARFALATPVEDRHEMFTVVFDQVKQFLEDAAKAAATQREAAASATTAAEASLTALAATAAAACAASDAAAEATRTLQDAAYLADNERSEAARTKKAAIQAQKVLQSKRAAIEKKQSKYTTVKPLDDLIEGTIEADKEKTKAWGAVERLFVSLNSEATLLSSAKVSLEKAPAQRGAYDKATIDYMKKTLTDKAAEFDAALAELAPDEAAAAERVASDTATAEEKAAAAEAAQTAFAAGEAAQRTADAAMVTAENARVEAEMEVSKQQGLVTTSEVLAGQVAVAVEALEFLAARSKVVPEDPVPEVPEELAPEVPKDAGAAAEAVAAEAAPAEA